MVALLADLGQLQNHVSGVEPGADGQRCKVDAGHHQIFAECAVGHLRAPGTEGLDLLQGQEGYLAVPFSGVGVAVHPPIGDETGLAHVLLLRPLSGAGADCHNGCHKTYPQ